MKSSSRIACSVICLVLVAAHPLSAQTADDMYKAKFEQRKKLWNQSSQFANEGNFNEAMELLEQAYSLEESVFGPAHAEMLGTLDVLAQLAERKQDEKQLIDIRKRQHRMMKHLYGEANYRTQDASRAITTAEQNATRSPEDRTRLQQAKELNNTAVKFFNEGNYAAAVQIAKQAAEIHKQVLGEQHPSYATSLNNLAEFYSSMGDNARAEPLSIRAMEIRNQVLGEQHPDHAASLHTLAGICAAMGNYPRAETLYIRATEVFQQVLGEQHPKYATCLNSLAVLYDKMGDYARAEPLFIRAMVIQKTVLGEQHPDYATSLNNLAELYRAMGDFARAESLSTQATEVLKKVVGEQHPIYSTSLANLAGICKSIGDYARAESLYGESIAIKEKVLGKENPEYASSLNGLAGLFLTMGQHSRAESIFREAIEIREKVLGKEHPDYAASLSSLAELYRVMCDYSRAEPLLKEELGIRERVQGRRHPDYANSLNSLAVFYYSMGDYSRAEPLFRETIAIQEALLGKKHPTYAISLNNLAMLYKTIGEYSRAETLHREAIAIRENTLGKEHPDYAASLNNLALLYQTMGDYGRAEPLYTLAIEINKQVLGEQHPNYASSLNNLALLYDEMGNYSRADSLLTKAMEIRQQALGEQHPSYAISLNNLAWHHHAMGDYGRAVPLYTRAIDISMQSLDKQAIILTEQQQIDMSKSLRYQLDNAVACALEMNPQTQTIAQQLFAWKGAVLVRLRGLRLAGNDPVIAQTFNQLQSKTRQLSALTNAVPGPDRLDVWKTQIAELTSQKEKLDTELMRNSVAFRSAQKKVTLDDVHQAIPTDGVIVDYFEYGGKQGRSLVATVIRRDVEPVMVDLGSAVDAANAISLWRASLGADDEAKQAGDQLRKQIWEPLLPHIGDAKLVFVSPDGVLGQMPFAALPGKAERSYLIEDHAIVMLPVPILLPKLMEREAGESKLLASSSGGKVTGLLMGDVDYDVASKTAPTTPTAEPNSSAPLLLANNTISRARGDTTYQPLAGTGPEIDAIAQLFRSHGDSADQNLIELRQRDATESAFRAAASSAQWLHLATHGFFAPADKKNALSAAEIDKSKSTLQMSGFDDNKHQPFVGFSPGQLSGLVFAGANQPPQVIDPLAPDQSIDDGIMTADEIAYMQLENVELAVLSACETGLGETAGGEGILGLQRAFQVAGARTTVTSLWQVDDAATQALMIEFYRNLFERKLSKLESLRQAQLWLLNHPEAIAGVDLTSSAATERGPERKIKITADTKTVADKPTRSLPAYWAAFQLSGDPR